MNFNNMPVARKLQGILVGPVLILLLLACALLYQFRQVDADLHQNLRASEERTALALRWQGMDALNMERAAASALATGDLVGAKAQQRMAQGIDDAAALRKRVFDAAPTPDERRLLERIGSDHGAVLQFTAQAQQARQAGDLGLARSTVEDKMQPALAAHTASHNAFVQLQERMREQTRAAADERKANALWVAGTLAGLVFLAGLGLVGWLVRSITLPLQRAMGMAGAIASGDLTVEAHDERRDELGHLLQSLSAMAAQLRGVVDGVRLEAQSVSRASAQGDTDHQSLSAHTRQTAADLKDTAASLEQVRASMAQSADTAQQASDIAAITLEVATHGGVVVEQAASSMEQLTATSRKMARTLSAIDALASQANILALNAAIEATRAGEEGHGFAAVASQGRLLAGRSAIAAKEMKALVGASVQSAETGAQQVVQAGQSMADMATSVHRMSDLVAGIAASCVGQHEGIAQASQAVAHLDQMAQQNAALDLQSSEAATALRAQAQHLAQAMAMFNVDMGAGASQGTPHGTAAVAAARFGLDQPLSGSAYPLPPDRSGTGSNTTAFVSSTYGLRTAASGKPFRRQPVMASDEDWESF